MFLRRSTISACVGAVGALLLAAPAPARIVEVGKAAQDPTPTCPSDPCLAVSRTTGYQVKVGSKRNVFTVPARGRIVAWSISLGDPDDRQTRFFDEQFGAARAGIAILRTGDRLFRRVVGQSPMYRLDRYFGRTVQFPLAQSIAVKKGYVVALTVPTWVPALTSLSGDGSSWRASRAKGHCDETDVQTAQTRRRALTQYRCLYRARLAYTATLITRPKPNKD
jgi:hypothetical protein